MDGTFSSHRGATQEEILPNALSSLQATADEVTHTVVPVSTVTAMVSGVVHQSL
ncbi:MAG: hypothetical protein WCP92_05105 [bacterium]